MKRMIMATVAVLTLLSGTAMGGLVGTTLDLELAQSGFVGDLAGPTGGTHLYGSLDTFVLQGAVTWNVSSPALHPDYDNSMWLDFTNFQYPSYSVLGPSTSTLIVGDLAEALEAGSVHVFLPSDLATDIATFVADGAAGFTVKWNVGTVAAANPINPGVVVAWNSVPAPGSLALISIAGLISRRRRRRG